MCVGAVGHCMKSCATVRTIVLIISWTSVSAPKLEHRFVIGIGRIYTSNTNYAQIDMC